MKKRFLTALALLTGMFLLSASIVWAAPPAPVEKTGQTISYRTGDDGGHEKGVVSPSPRFIDNGDGTVTDNLTGLMWAKDANLNNGTRTWNDAIDYANNLTLGVAGCGSTWNDWRLPNVKELQSLIDFGNYGPALPTGHPFIDVQNHYYWSSTTYQNGADAVWSLTITNGYQDVTYKTASSLYVWPVRSAN